MASGRIGYVFFRRKSGNPGFFGAFWGVLGVKKGQNGCFRPVFKAACAVRKLRKKRIFFAQNGRKDPSGQSPDRPLTNLRHHGEIQFGLQVPWFWGQNGLLGRILYFSQIGLERAQKRSYGGNQGVRSILLMPGIPKSSGLGTIWALYGGLRGHNRKLANRCKGPKKIENRKNIFFSISKICWPFKTVC